MCYATEPMRSHTKIYVDGGWVDPKGKGSAEVIHSASEEVIGRVPLCDAADVDAAVAAARRAFGGWSQTGVAERAEWLARIGEGLAARADELAELIAGEVGMPLKLSKMIQAMGFAREEVYIANVVKCRPPENRNPEPDEIERCERLLDEFLRGKDGGERIEELPLDALGRVPWWSEDHNQVTLASIMVHVIVDLARHVGHADILREEIDGAAGLRAEVSNIPQQDWPAYVAKLTLLAERF